MTADHSNILKLALEAALCIKDTSRKNRALFIIAKTQAQTNNVDSSQKTAQLINDESYHSHALSAIALHQSKRGLFTQALETACNISSKPFDSSRDKTIESIAIAQATAGLFEEALASAQLVGISTDGIIYKRTEILAKIAELQIKAGRSSDAIATISRPEMLSLRKENRAELLTSLAIEMARAGQYSDATGIALQFSDRDEDDGLTRKVHIVRQIAIEQATAGQYLDSLATIELIQALPLGIRSRDLVISAISNAQTSSRHFIDALNNARKIIDKFISAETLLSIATSMGDRRIMEEALHTARQISDPLERATILAKIAETLHDTALFHEALNAISDEHFFVSRCQIISEFGNALCEAGKLEDALKIAELLPDTDSDRIQLERYIVTLQIEAGAYLEALSAAVRTYQFDELSRSLFELLTPDLREASLDFVSGCDSAPVRARLLGYIAAALSDATILLDAVYLAGTIQEEPARDIAFMFIAAAQGRRKKYPTAILVAKLINDNKRCLRALRETLTSQIDDGLYSEATLLTQCLIEKPWQDEFFGLISLAQARAGLSSDALKNVRRISDPSHRVNVLCDIALTL